MNFLESKKIMELIFNLLSFDVIVIYRDANCRKKVNGVGLDFSLIRSSTAILCFPRCF